MLHCIKLPLGRVFEDALAAAAVYSEPLSR